MTRQIAAMRIHGSCAARDGVGVLLVGPPGSGKSDLTLRLLDRAFTLVADDQVEIDDMIACPPVMLAGLLEVRGLGIVRLPYVAPVRLALCVRLGAPATRLPERARICALGLPEIDLDPNGVSAAQRVELALDCVLGSRTQLAGAFERVGTKRQAPS